MKAIWMSLLTFSFLGSAHADEARTAVEGRIAVCRVAGTDLARSGLRYFSELVQTELAKANNLEVVDEIITCSRDPESVAVSGRSVGADKVVAGDVASVGDLFVVKLRLVDCATNEVVREESIEDVGARLDPRLLVRTAAQRLAGIGGWDTLKESYVHISSTPADARVFINGLLEGNAPVKVRVAPGRHQISALLPEHSEWSLGVDVKHGETLSLNASLVDVLKATQSKSDGGKILLGFAVPYAVAFGQGALYLSDVKSGPIWAWRWWAHPPPTSWRPMPSSGLRSV